MTAVCGQATSYHTAAVTGSHCSCCKRPPHVHLPQVLVLSTDSKRGRVTLSTKKLEATPGDMLRDPQLVYEGAEQRVQRRLEEKHVNERRVLKDEVDSAATEGTAENGTM